MKATRELIAPLALGVALLLAWWALTATGDIPAMLLPGPLEVAPRVAADLIGGRPGAPLRGAPGACLPGAAVALPLAILIHRNRWFAAATAPFLGATQAIPAIALAPLLVLWIGYGLVSVVALCGLMVFFPILISSVVGLRHVDAKVIDAARMDGATSRQLLTHVELPLALPSILAGLRNGFTLSVTGAVVGEMVMGGNGLGTVLTVQRDAVDTAGMFSSILVLCAIASGMYSLIHL